MELLELLKSVGGYLVIFSGEILFFGLLLSFMGGFAGAIAAGGREDRSLLYNFGIGLAGTVIGTAIWSAYNGGWPEEVTAGALVLSFLASIGVALVVNRLERRNAGESPPGSQTPGVSV
jgi:uncharacterized membrane protein YeaQ/YmgE (transglycosylase-associated protein family)